MPDRVLIAEEQLECFQIFQIFLQRCGYEVTTVHDGMSCLKALQDGASPDVLILSWELPWGEGETVLDWLEHQGLDDTAVVVLTARIDAVTDLPELSLPGVAWVQRPFGLMELGDAIQSAKREKRDSWKCLEALWRKSIRPVNGVSEQYNN